MVSGGLFWPFPISTSLSLDVCSDRIHRYISKSGVRLDEKGASSMTGANKSSLPPYLNMSAGDMAMGAQSDEKVASIM